MSKEYITLQIKVIIRFCKRFNLDEAEGSMIFAQQGYAKKFYDKHRELSGIEIERSNYDMKPCVN